MSDLHVSDTDEAKPASKHKTKQTKISTQPSLALAWNVMAKNVGNLSQY